MLASACTVGLPRWIAVMALLATAVSTLASTHEASDLAGKSEAEIRAEMEQIKEMIRMHRAALNEDANTAGAKDDAEKEGGQPTPADATDEEACTADEGKAVDAAELAAKNAGASGWDETTTYAVHGGNTDGCSLDVVSKLSVSEFNAKYLGKKPVVVTGVADDWPANTHWRREALKSK